VLDRFTPGRAAALLLNGCSAEAPNEARERAVVLLDDDDVRALVAGASHIADLVDERIDDLVRRY
jgi:hypothetical protein